MRVLAGLNSQLQGAQQQNGVHSNVPSSAEEQTGGKQGKPQANNTKGAQSAVSLLLSFLRDEFVLLFLFDLINQTPVLILSFH